MKNDVLTLKTEFEDLILEPHYKDGLTYIENAKTRKLGTSTWSTHRHVHGRVFHNSLKHRDSTTHYFCIGGAPFYVTGGYGSPYTRQVLVTRTGYNKELDDFIRKLNIRSHDTGWLYQLLTFYEKRKDLFVEFQYRRKAWKRLMKKFFTCNESLSSYIVNKD
jgi:hypothetical protein